MSEQSLVLDAEPVGVTPKVKLPAKVLGAIGVVLVAASYLVVGLESVREVGFTLIGASPLAGILGYNAKLGPVAKR